MLPAEACSWEKPCSLLFSQGGGEERENLEIRRGITGAEEAISFVNDIYILWYYTDVMRAYGPDLPPGTIDQKEILALPTQEAAVLRGHDGPVLAVRFNEQGTYCLSCGKVGGACNSFGSKRRASASARLIGVYQIAGPNHSSLEPAPGNIHKDVCRTWIRRERCHRRPG
jgi:hypothetical protein